MRVKTSSLCKGLLTCLLLLSFVSVLHAADHKRFTLKEGVIYDSELGLQWAPANGRAMNHYKAEEYIQNLRLAGGGWRLPTRAELKSLYDKSKPRNADPVFNINNNWVWTSELDGPSLAWAFSFGYGFELSYPRDNSDYFHVLAVRSRRC